MGTKKVVFIAFAIEDERQRDFLKGQSLNTNSPFGEPLWGQTYTFDIIAYYIKNTVWIFV